MECKQKFYLPQKHLTDEYTNFLIAHEFDDFIEFLDDEFGVDWRKEVYGKFLYKMEGKRRKTKKSKQI